MKVFLPGDLVLHDMESRWGPSHDRPLVGIVIRSDKKYDDYFEIFWYTTGKIQSIHQNFIKRYEDK